MTSEHWERGARGYTEMHGTVSSNNTLKTGAGADFSYYMRLYIEGVIADEMPHLGLRNLLKKLRGEVAAGAERPDDAKRRLSFDGGCVRDVAYCGWSRGAMTPSLGYELISAWRGLFEMQTLTL